VANAVSGIVLLLVLGGITLFPRATADVFCHNLKQVAATLPKNTASSPSHFATNVFAHAPDVVYALAFCRGDVVNDTTCGECVATTFDAINSTLSPAQQLQCYRAAYYYGGGCSLVYSVDDILSSSNTTGGNNNGNWSTNNISGDTDDVALTGGLLNELLVKTIQTAASTTPGRFTTGVMDSPTIVFYSMAQCTPDLSDSKCLACLTRLLGTLNFTMTLRMGGQLHVIRCFFRYESYKFYDSKPILHLGRPSAPTPVTAPVKHKSKFPWL